MQKNSSPYVREVPLGSRRRRNKYKKRHKYNVPGGPPTRAWLGKPRNKNEQEFFRQFNLAYPVAGQGNKTRKVGDESVPFELNKVLLAKYCVDFVFGALVVEIDEKHHRKTKQAEQDRLRDEALVKAGYSVLRIPTDELSTATALLVAAVSAGRHRFVGKAPDEETRLRGARAYAKRWLSTKRAEAKAFAKRFSQLQRWDHGPTSEPLPPRELKPPRSEVLLF